MRNPIPISLRSGSRRLLLSSPAETVAPRARVGRGCTAADAVSRCLTLFTVLLVGWTAASPARGASILQSKHNLSALGPGAIKAALEGDVCIFCHTPHGASSEAPLWNRFTSGATYIPYSSSTVKATIGQPTGASKLCLSCHDGTVALGMVRSRPTPIKMQSDVTVLPAGASQLGTDLADDHPISFVYDSALAAAHGGALRDPETLTGSVKLDKEGQLQCTSCHDPHDDQFGKFLVQANTGSALCTVCHSPPHWTTTSHRTSIATWNGQGTDPWPRTADTTVAANACANCHAPHGAGTKPRLLNFPVAEDNCLSCHSGTVAAKNLLTEFNKFSVHSPRISSGAHDPTEDPINPPRHATCVDCHNPHASRSAPATAPEASGALAGVRGVTTTGTVIESLTKEYELCFRCHGDSVDRGPARVPRQYVETNTRLEFAPGNASFHPVQSTGRNPNVPSLIAPWTAASLIYCTDCHNNNQGPGAGGSGPNGPHGSAFEPILERQLLVTDNSDESTAAYALCYKCHSRNSILNDESFKEHRRHIVDHRTACTTCHDSHGVQGKTHLINFNPNYATPSGNGLLEFVDTGLYRGNCSVTCHGTDHRALPYSR